MTRVFVRRGGSESREAEIVLDSRKNLQTGEGKFKSVFTGITTLESDLLLLGASVFAADRCIKRGERENLARRIELFIPAVNIEVLQPFASRLDDILRTLSHDAWRINFRQARGGPEKDFAIPASAGKTLLFSGGLDSLAATIEFGREHAGLQLISHMTRNRQTTVAQTALARLLAGIGLQFSHKQFLVSATSVPPGAHLRFDAESSQRTRSFLYLILAALSARRAGHREIIMIAENGQMAIHLPLTQGRISAFSTHTAHPEVLSKMEAFLHSVLSSPIRIVNPYVYRTKGEVVRVPWEELPDAIPIAISCWRSARLPANATHCGDCIPCIVRRVAIECHGVDPTIYARDLLNQRVTTLPEDDNGRRNLMDFAEFNFRMERSSEIEIVTEWPELYSPQINRTSATQMYKRAAVEARSVLSRYPGLTPLLQ